MEIVRVYLVNAGPRSKDVWSREDEVTLTAEVNGVRIVADHGDYLIPWTNIRWLEYGRKATKGTRGTRKAAD